MTVVGVTGGLASGKSTVLDELGRLGACTIDADAIVHALLAEHKPTQQAIEEAFGAEVRGASGGIRRDTLAAKVFSDPAALATLCAIVHPPVIERIRRQLRDFQSEGVHVVAVEVPLLVEARLQDLVDIILVVAASEAEQLARAQATRGWTEAEARARIAAQAPASAKQEIADIIIDNAGTVEALHDQVSAWWTGAFGARQ